MQELGVLQFFFFFFIGLRKKDNNKYIIQIIMLVLGFLIALFLLEGFMIEYVLPKNLSYDSSVQIGKKYELYMFIVLASLALVPSWIRVIVRYDFDYFKAVIIYSIIIILLLLYLIESNWLFSYYYNLYYI